MSDLSPLTLDPRRGDRTGESEATRGITISTAELAAEWEQRMDATRAAWGDQVDAGLALHTRGDVPRGWRVGWTTQLRVCTMRAMVQQVRVTVHLHCPSSPQ